MSTQHQGEQLDALLTLGPLIPVITIHDLDDAVPLARALVAGGVRLLEITLRTEVGLAAAEAIGRSVPEAVVGVGTVLTPEDLKRAIDVGARFALSPGATRDLLDAAMTAPIPFLPGVATASELMEAAARGFRTVKFFPASSMGGLSGPPRADGAFPNNPFLSDRRRGREQCRRLAGDQERRRNRRVMANSSRGGLPQRLDRHHATG